MKQGEIHLGTSTFTAAGWPGTFYPEGMKPAEYLSYYAKEFDTVEVDATFYRTPSLGMTMKGRKASAEKVIVRIHPRDGAGEMARRTR